MTTHGVGGSSDGGCRRLDRARSLGVSRPLPPSPFRPGARCEPSEVQALLPHTKCKWTTVSFSINNVQGAQAQDVLSFHEYIDILDTICFPHLWRFTYDSGILKRSNGLVYMKLKSCKKTSRSMSLEEAGNELMVGQIDLKANGFILVSGGKWTWA